MNRLKRAILVSVMVPFVGHTELLELSRKVQFPKSDKETLYVVIDSQIGDRKSKDVLKAINDKLQKNRSKEEIQVVIVSSGDQGLLENLDHEDVAFPMVSKARFDGGERNPLRALGLSGESENGYRLVATGTNAEQLARSMNEKVTRSHFKGSIEGHWAISSKSPAAIIIWDKDDEKLAQLPEAIEAYGKGRYQIYGITNGKETKKSLPFPNWFEGGRAIQKLLKEFHPKKKDFPMVIFIDPKQKKKTHAHDSELSGEENANEEAEDDGELIGGGVVLGAESLDQFIENPNLTENFEPAEKLDFNQLVKDAVTDPNQYDLYGPAIVDVTNKFNQYMSEDELMTMGVHCAESIFFSAKADYQDVDSLNELGLDQRAQLSQIDSLMESANPELDELQRSLEIARNVIELAAQNESGRPPEDFKPASIAERTLFDYDDDDTGNVIAHSQGRYFEDYFESRSPTSLDELTQAIRERQVIAQHVDLEHVVENADEAQHLLDPNVLGLPKVGEQPTPEMTAGSETEPPKETYPHSWYFNQEILKDHFHIERELIRRIPSMSEDPNAGIEMSRNLYATETDEFLRRDLLRAQDQIVERGVETAANTETAEAMLHNQRQWLESQMTAVNQMIAADPNHPDMTMWRRHWHSINASIARNRMRLQNLKGNPRTQAAQPVSGNQAKPLWDYIDEAMDSLEGNEAPSP